MTMIPKKTEFRRVLERAHSPSKFRCIYRVLPYVGCTFGCLYCSKSIGREPKPDKAESKEGLHVKINAPEVLKTELKKARLGLVCICGYQPLEREEKIIRQLLDILAARAFPVHIIAKSEIVLDDMDIFKRIAKNNFCSVSLCVSTMDKSISNIFEPNTPPPKVRMDALGKLARAGITAGLAIMPVIPHITDGDEHLEELIRLAAQKKATYVLFDSLRLEDGIRLSVIDALKRHYPEHLVKYKRLYEFGAAPESRYVRHLKANIRHLRVKYDLEEGIPYKEADRKSRQVKLETY